MHTERQEKEGSSGSWNSKVLACTGYEYFWELIADASTLGFALLRGLAGDFRGAEAML